MKTFCIIIGVICLYYDFLWMGEPSMQVDKTIQKIVDIAQHGDLH